MSDSPELAASEPDAWLWWKLCLAARHLTDEEREENWKRWPGGRNEAGDGIPQTGYYETKVGPAKARRRVPVLIWYEVAMGPGSRLCEQQCNVDIAGKRSTRPAIDTWQRCGDYAISHGDYLYWMEHQRFPGEVDIAAPALRPNVEDPYGDFRDQLIGLAGQIEIELRIVGAEVVERVVADRLANLAGLGAQAEKQAQALLKEQTEDAKKAIKATNELWNISIGALGDAVGRVKALLTPFLQQQKDAGLDTKVGGQSGRRISLRAPWRAEIEDWELALTHFKSSPELRDLLQKLANRCATSPKDRETPIPGVRFTQGGKAA